MVDAMQFAESDYVTKELVRTSPSKTAVIVSQEVETVTKDNQQIQRIKLAVEIDGKRKIYNPNRPSVKNLINGFGAETAGWLQKVIRLDVVQMGSHEGVLAYASIPPAAVPQTPTAVSQPAAAATTTVPEPQSTANHAVVTEEKINQG